MYSDSLQSGQIGLGGTAGSFQYDEYKLLDAFVVLGEYQEYATWNAGALMVYFRWPRSVLIIKTEVRYVPPTGGRSPPA